MAITREQLYEQVWSRPMLAVAQEHGVSGNYLARVCAALNVPWPPRGYWAKVAAGQKPKRPPLPLARPGEQGEWTKGAGLDLRSRPVRPAKKPAPTTTEEAPAGPEQPTRHQLVTAASTRSTVTCVPSKSDRVSGILAWEVVRVDQVLPDRHRVATHTQGLFNEGPVGFAGARGRRPLAGCIDG